MASCVAKIAYIENGSSFLISLESITGSAETFFNSPAILTLWLSVLK